MPRHNSTDLKTSWKNQADTRQICAIDSSTGEMIVLARGDADFYREKSRADQLLCPVCEEPLIVRGSDKVNDHFAHHSGASHGGETLQHILGKEVITQLVNRLLKAQVAYQEETIEGTQRRADILVRTPKNLKDIDIEIEYERTQPEKRLERNRELLENNTATQWIFGSSRFETIQSHDTYKSMDCLVVRIPEDIRETVSTKEFILVIDPENKLVGTIFGYRLENLLKEIEIEHFWDVKDSGNPPSKYVLPGKGIYDRGYMYINRLEDCTINPKSGLVTPAMSLWASHCADMEITVRKKWESYDRLRSHIKCEEAKQESQNKRKEAEKKRWTSSELYQKVHSGKLGKKAKQYTSFDDVKDAENIHIHPHYWQALLWEEFVSHNTGRIFTVQELVDYLDENGIEHEEESSKVNLPLLSWVWKLKARGIFSQIDSSEDYVTIFSDKA